MSTSNMDKFQEAICAFANDMHGKREKGYLLIGVTDDGKIGGLTIDDALMKRISGIRSDGNILPLPVMSTEKITTTQGDVLLVEVTPSFETPVRYRGRTFIRIGPRRDIASAEEERILSERCASSLPTFDTHPCRGASLNDIDIDAILNDYMPKAIAPEVLANDKRTLREQLASLHLYNSQYDCPTYASIIMFGKSPRYFLPGAYIQYVRFSGEDNSGEILNERRFESCLFKSLPIIESFISDAIITTRPVPVSILREQTVVNYPFKALRELLMNAVMHRDYQSNMPIRFYQYNNHIELMNPGGLYGQARPENFPHVNDYRNSVIAEIMRNLNYVNMFNHGIYEVGEQLRANNCPEPIFNVNLMTAFSVIVKEPVKKSLTNSGNVGDNVNHLENKEFIELLYQNNPHIGKACGKVGMSALIKVLLLCQNPTMVREIARLVGIKSRATLDRYILKPLRDDALLQFVIPGKPKHPKQKYVLSAKGYSTVEMFRQFFNRII